MFLITGAKAFGSRFVSFVVVIAVFAAASAIAQTAGKKYDVELAVKKDQKKSVMTDAVIVFNETGIQIVPDKAAFKSFGKEFSYASIKHADASYAKKPMLSGGGAVATALLVSVFLAVPLLFIKKKKHWMTVQSEGDFAVMQLGDNNWREIAAEFQTHGVKVNDLGNEGK